MANTLKLGNGKWATGKDTLMSFSDTNNNFKPLPFSFSRASSATVVNQSGLIETVGSGTPRIDFLGNTKGALLLEPQRTNLFEYSESFSNSYWTKNGITESIGYLAPDGTLNAYKLIANAVDSSMYEVFSVTSGTTYSLSFYLKTVSGTLDTTIGLGSPGFPQNEGDGGRYKNITVTNEWKRYTLTSTADATASSGISFGGFSGFTTGEEVLIYGAQLEVGSYATSYIPTSGQSGGVTRVADACNQTTPDGVIGQTEGTVFVNFKPQNLDATSRYLSVENSSSVSNGWMGVFASLVSGSIRFRFYGDGWDIDSPLIIEKGTRYKIAFSYKNGVQTSIYVNGNLLNNITASLSGKSYQKIRLSEAAIGNRGDADFNDIKLYNTIKTDAELAALTTI